MLNFRMAGKFKINQIWKTVYSNSSLSLPKKNLRNETRTNVVYHAIFYATDHNSRRKLCFSIFPISNSKLNFSFFELLTLLS